VKYRARTVSSLGAIALGTFVGVATSHAANATSSDESPGAQLQEVVVTAEKRTSNLQRTPISMAVISSSELSTLGTSDLEQLSVVSPDLNMSDSTGREIVTIRGISSQDTTEIGNPAVSVSVDGVYIQRPVDLTASLYDLDRVEVLRGPQGTLYGGSAVGGAINIVTAKPTDQREGSVSMTYGNYGTITTTGMMNIPVNDRLQLRASFYTDSHTGYRNNYPVPQRGDDDDTKSARLEALFKVTDHLTALITGEYTTVGGVGSVIDGLPVQYDSNGNLIVKTPHFANNGSSWGLSTQGYTDLTVKALRWQFNWDLGFADATYLGGFARTQFDHMYDLDGGVLTTWAYQNDDVDDTQDQELRLSSKPGGPWVWQAGLYYLDEGQTINDHFDNIPGPTIVLFTYDYPLVTAKSYAAFGQLTYHLTDTLDISAGARYQEDKKSRLGTQDTANLGDYLSNGSLVYTLASENGSSQSSKTTWHAGINWFATSSNMLYAKVDTGYKAGGFSTLNQYGPETVTAFEAGSKNRWLGNRLQFNVAAFLENYDNQQVDVFIPAEAGDLIENAGKSRISGVETDLLALLTPNDRVDLSLDYLHARFLPFLADNGNGNVNIGGNYMDQAPDVSIGLDYAHDWNLSAGVLTADVHSAFKSAYYFSIFNTADTRQSAYSDTDHPHDSNWTFAGYVRNLENNVVLVNATEQAFFGTDAYELAPPRTFGVTITTEF